MAKAAPKQKIVRIKRELVKSPYQYCSMKSKYNAAKRLSGNGYKLWDYLISNQHDYEFALSNVALRDTMGLARNTYNSAVNELIKNGFLEQEIGQRYTFFEYPSLHKKQAMENAQKSGNGHCTKTGQEIIYNKYNIENNITTSPTSGAVAEAKYL